MKTEIEAAEALLTIARGSAARAAVAEVAQLAALGEPAARGTPGNPVMMVENVERRSMTG